MFYYSGDCYCCYFLLCSKSEVSLGIYWEWIESTNHRSWSATSFPAIKASFACCLVSWLEMFSSGRSDCSKTPEAGKWGMQLSWLWDSIMGHKLYLRANMIICLLTWRSIYWDLEFCFPNESSVLGIESNRLFRVNPWQGIMFMEQTAGGKWTVLWICLPVSVRTTLKLRYHWPSRSIPSELYLLFFFF